MLPIQIVGLALAGRTLLTKYTNTDSKGNRVPLNINIPKIKLPDSISKILTGANPIESLTRALAPSLSHLKKIAFGDGRTNENYSDIVKKFIPRNAMHLVPQHPQYTEEIHLTDLDGDLSRELITSYKLDNEIRTIILKKQEDMWNKISEINNTGHDILNYRDVVDIAGTGKRYLLLGLSSRGKPSILYGYELENGTAKEVFAHSYSRIEVLHKALDRNIPSKADLIIWNKLNDGTYDIAVHRVNDNNLEQVEEDLSSYYKKKAVPYFVRKTKQAPNLPVNWYNLANALEKAGALRDASTAIAVGMDIDRTSYFKDKFAALKSKIDTK